MDGDMIARADSLDGLRERSLDALELVAGVPQARRQEIGQMLGSRDDDDPYAIEQSRATAEYVLAAADPAYHRAFRKILRNPTQGFLTWTEQERAAYARTESVRTAMSLTSANGGYLVPFTLDPTIVLSNTGALNPFRELGTIKTTATNTWNGVSSAGVTAAWLGEGVEAADASPTVANIAITTQKAAAWVYGSYEVLGDSDFGTQLPDLLADAKNRLEEAAFATGSGTLQPWGAVTRATTVNSATAATFASADIYAVAAAMPDRWYANASFVANKSIGLKIRQMDTAGGSAFWANLGGATPQELLGRRYRESTTMVSTTTTGSKNLLLGDFSQYYIADRLGMQVLYEPMVKSTANGRPSGQAGWFAFWRVGADTAVANAFRVLIET
jgi:HK97 family phage major capsid protein